MLSLLRGTDIRIAIHTCSHDLHEDTDQVNEIKSTVDDIYVFHFSLSVDPHFMASFSPYDHEIKFCTLLVQLSIV